MGPDLPRTIAVTIGPFAAAGEFYAVNPVDNLGLSDVRTVDPTASNGLGLGALGTMPLGQS